MSQTLFSDVLLAMGQAVDGSAAVAEFVSEAWGEGALLRVEIDPDLAHPPVLKDGPVVQLVADYLNSNLRSMLAVNSDKEGSTMAQVTITPTSDRLRIRLERHKARLYLDRADFRRFLADRGADARQVQSDLRTSGVLVADNTKYVLGKGTIYSGGQTLCWVLNFDAPALSGVVGSVDTIEQEAV